MPIAPPDHRQADLIAGVAQEIKENGSALVRPDLAREMIDSGLFVTWEGDETPAAYIPLKLASGQA